MTKAGYLVLAMVAAATVAGLAIAPSAGGTAASADRVIIAGAAGLRWEDVDPERTPNLWALAAAGTIGALSVRSAHQPTCASDGWLTLGAGNWASGTTRRPSEAECEPLDVTIEPAESAEDPSAVNLENYQRLVQYNQREQPWGAVPGALAGSVGCTVAVGEGAALAAARSYGRVDRYRANLPSDPDTAAEVLAAPCELAIVDLGTVSGSDPVREAAVRRVDRALARVLAARPAGSLLLVVGVAETDTEPHLHVAAGDGPGLGPGWLTSPTTGRIGYLELMDIAPTALATLDRPAPEGLFAGRAADSRPGRPADLAEAVTELADADRRTGLARPVSGWFLAGLTVAQLLLLAAVLPLLLWPAGSRPIGVRSVPGWWRTAGPIGLVAAGLAIPVALVVDRLPWWQVQSGAGVFAVASLLVLAAAGLLLARTATTRRTLGLIAAGAGVAVGGAVVDLLTRSWRQLSGVVGYSAYEAERYAGLSDVGLGVLIAGTLLIAGCLAERVARRHRPLVVAGVGAVGVVLAGSPYLGGEVGGAVGLMVGVCLAAALCTGGWLTSTRVAAAVCATLAVLALVAVVELSRPDDRRIGLGGVLTQLTEGGAGSGLRRMSVSNVEAFTDTPLTVLAVIAAGFIWFALLRPWGGLRRLFGIHPALRAAMAGAVTASLLGGVLVGAALTVAGAAAAVGVPLLTLAALRLRERSERPAPIRASRVSWAADDLGPVRVEFRGSSGRPQA